MTTATDTTVTTQVYRVYIKATPQAIWDAITKPEWTERYGYGGRAEYDLRPGGAYRGPRRARRCRRAGVARRRRRRRGDRGRPAAQARPDLADASWTRTMAAEGFTRLTYEIEEGEGGVTKLTVTHELEGAPTLHDGRRRAGGHGRRRRLELGAQRPEDAARDRQAARGLSRDGGGPAQAGSPPLASDAFVAASLAGVR